MTLFGTAGIRGAVTDTVTPELGLAVGRAVAAEAGDTVVLGRDGRITGRGLADAVAAGLQSGGVDVLRVGQTPTPAIAMASRGRHGIAVTASHNPPADNGLKCFVDGVEYGDDGEDRIATRVEEGSQPVDWRRWGDTGTREIIEQYVGEVVEYARSYGDGLAGERVVVDCGNGVGALATPTVLDRLGADVTTLHGNVDGHFPGRRSKPTPETLTDLQAFMTEAEATVGIAHDGDADRVVFLDGDGEIVHEDTVLAILAAHYLDASPAPDPVVLTTPNASGRIDERVAAVGGRTERVRLGALHEGIARVEREGGTVVFAAEPWKHIHPRHGGWIDGVASAAVLAQLVAKSSWETLRAPIRERPYRKVSVDCPEEAKAAVMADLETGLPETLGSTDVSTEHGVRVSFEDGSWTLVRPSGTEPKIRIYAESDAVDSLVEDVCETVRSAIDRAEASTRG